jgi:hypothetical protein
MAYRNEYFKLQLLDTFKREKGINPDINTRESAHPYNYEFQTKTIHCAGAESIGIDLSDSCTYDEGKGHGIVFTSDREGRKVLVPDGRHIDVHGDKVFYHFPANVGLL